MKHDNLPVVYFRDLPHAERVQLQKVSYGDAQYTLVTPRQIIDEVCSIMFEQTDPLNELVQALATIPFGVLVALEG